MEGVSRQYSGTNGIQPGISCTIAAWTDTEQTQGIDLFTWKKGDPSKIETAVNKAIKLAPQVNTFATLYDGAFINQQMIKDHNTAGVFFFARFHSNRKITVVGDHHPECQIQYHPAFWFKKNKRIIIRQIDWHGEKLCVIALKIKHPSKGWVILFIATNMSTEKARECTHFFKYRWKIEVAIRTCKQRFGLGDCLARTLKQQEAHGLAVLTAYNSSQPPPAKIPKVSAELKILCGKR